jgi:xylulokinase
MLNNKIVGSHFHNLDFNVHTFKHIVRAAQEGIAFAFRYGLDIMRENGMNPSIIRAGKANMFLSEVFTESFVNTTGVPVELYQTDGSIGAAFGAGVGIGYYEAPSAPFVNSKKSQIVGPSNHSIYNSLYEEWKSLLQAQLEKQEDFSTTMHVAEKF